ncbi:MAG: hypothetical protein JWQ10_284 [Herbaspirillum sp.]|nr:hypothetical protein [Herbaspirillum sp.]
MTTLNREKLLEPISEQAARFAIDGAIAYGRMGHNKPPEDDHWLMPYWEIGRQLAAQSQDSGYITTWRHVGGGNICDSNDRLIGTFHGDVRDRDRLIVAINSQVREPSDQPAASISSATESSDRALPALRVEGEA